MNRWSRAHATIRAELIAQLGGVCRWADGTCEGGLELDHIHGRDYKVAALSSHMRARRYRAEAAAGLLQVLCRKHNARKGATLEKRGVHQGPHLPLPDEPPAWLMEQLA